MKKLLITLCILSLTGFGIAKADDFYEPSTEAKLQYIRGLIIIKSDSMTGLWLLLGRQLQLIRII